MAEMVPEDAGLFAHYNIQTMRDDKDLDDAYESIEERFDEIDDFGIDIEDTNYMVDAGSIMILRGKFDLEDVRDELDDANFDKDDYKDVELWLDESEAFAISKDDIIYGLKDNVKDCIKVMKGSEETVYEGDFKDVIDKLPDGIATRVKTSDFEYKDALAWGVVLMKEDEDTLLEQGVIKFDGEDGAEDVKSEVKRNLKKVLDDVEVTQNGKFLEYTGKKDIAMVIAGWGGLIGGSGCVKDMAKMVPEGTSKFIHCDLQAIRNDKDLRGIYTDMTERGFIGVSKAEELGIDIDYINHYMTTASGITILRGKFDLEDVRDELDDADFDKDDYKDVELWLGESEAVAISGNRVIYGLEDNVKGCIKVMKGSEESIYEGDEDFRMVIDKLPGGIVTKVFLEYIYAGTHAMGFVLTKEDEDTLELKGVIKFDYEDDAEDAKSELKQELRDTLDDIVVKQNGEFLGFTGMMDIEDWEKVF
jgi:TATA-box binding protein (TBP) (component of TFIID and TFIIIB)